MTDLPPCVRCNGTGRVRNPGDHHTTTVEAAAAYEQHHEGFHATHRQCPACKGDGTQIRADLELMADAMAIPSIRQQTIAEVVTAVRARSKSLTTNGLVADFIEREFASVPSEQERS